MHVQVSLHQKAIMGATSLVFWTLLVNSIHTHGGSQLSCLEGRHTPFSNGLQAVWDSADLQFGLVCPHGMDRHHMLEIKACWVSLYNAALGKVLGPC